MAYLGVDEVIELGAPGTSGSGVPVSHVRSVLDAWTRRHAARVTELAALEERLASPDGHARYRSWVKGLGCPIKELLLDALAPGEKWESVRRTAWGLLGAAQSMDQAFGAWMSREGEQALSLGIDRALLAVDQADLHARPVRRELAHTVGTIAASSVRDLADAETALGRIIGKSALSVDVADRPPQPAPVPTPSGGALAWMGEHWVELLLGAGSLTALALIIPPLVRRTR